MLQRTAHPLNECEGPIAITAPHMDDEIIGCGIHLATLHDQRRAFFFFGGDGLGSFSSSFVDQQGADVLKSIRKAEAAAAVRAVGCTPENAYFADFPEWHFSRYPDRVDPALHAWLDRLNPAICCTPFRFDAHPDHLALGNTVRTWAAAHPEVVLYEYFVYPRFRLLPGGDIRRYVAPACLRWKDPAAAASEAKTAALQAYVSQTTRYDPSWARPVLNDVFVKEVAHERECLLDTRALASHPDWMRRSTYVQWVHAVEPRLKRIKDGLQKTLRFSTKKPPVENKPIPSGSKSIRKRSYPP